MKSQQLLTSSRCLLAVSYSKAILSDDTKFTIKRSKKCLQELVHIVEQLQKFNNEPASRFRFDVLNN